MTPVALEVRVVRAAKNLLAHYKDNPDPQFDKKTYAEHKEAVKKYVDETRQKLVSADPTIWDQILYKTTGCLAIVCENSDEPGKKVAMSGLKTCRKCSDIDKDNPFVKKMEDITLKEMITA